MDSHSIILLSSRANPPSATALGAFQMAIALAALPGGYLAGLFWDKINPATTFWYGGILALISFLLLQLFKPAISALSTVGAISPSCSQNLREEKCRNKL